MRIFKSVPSSLSPLHLPNIVCCWLWYSTNEHWRFHTWHRTISSSLKEWCFCIFCITSQTCSHGICLSYDYFCWAEWYLQPVSVGLNDHFLSPADAMRTATATMNINNMLPSTIYVLPDDLRNSPNKTIPQKVLTSGSACSAMQIQIEKIKIQVMNTVQNLKMKKKLMNCVVGLVWINLSLTSKCIDLIRWVRI